MLNRMMGSCVGLQAISCRAAKQVLDASSDYMQLASWTVHLLLVIDLLSLPGSMLALDGLLLLYQILNDGFFAEQEAFRGADWILYAETCTCCVLHERSPRHVT